MLKARVFHVLRHTLSKSCSFHDSRVALKSMYRLTEGYMMSVSLTLNVAPVPTKAQRTSVLKQDDRTQRDDTVQLFTRRPTQTSDAIADQHEGSRDKPACNTSCQQTRKFVHRGLCPQQTIRIRATQRHSATTRQHTLRWFIPLTRNCERCVGHTKFRLEILNRALRRHSGIGIQRCCLNKMLLPLAIDTQSLSQRRKQAGTRRVCTTCALDAVEHALNALYTTSSDR